MCGSPRIRHCSAASVGWCSNATNALAILPARLLGKKVPVWTLASACLDSSYC